jgi:hypothetical protein
VPTLSPDMIELLEGGVSIGIASRDAELRPECAHGLGLRVAPDRGAVTVYVNEDTSARLVQSLQVSGRAAVVVSRILDHHTIQLKGRVLAVRPGDEADHAIQDRYVIAYAEQVAMIGLPRQIVRSVRLRPCLAIEIAIDDLFVQTPGPQAGRRMGAVT